MTQKIRTCFWFDHQAEEAASFYCSLLADSRITKRVAGQDGKALMVEFELAGVSYLALNGGPHFRLSEAASLVVDCVDQAEVDRLWEALTAEGKESQCGWLKDKFGLSWQIVPSALPRLLADPTRAARVTKVMLTMKKLDIRQLEEA